jgi:hypothetical protein
MARDRDDLWITSPGVGLADRSARTTIGVTSRHRTGGRQPPLGARGVPAVGGRRQRALLRPGGRGRSLDRHRHHRGLRGVREQAGVDRRCFGPLLERLDGPLSQGVPVPAAETSAFTRLREQAARRADFSSSSEAGICAGCTSRSRSAQLCPFSSKAAVSIRADTGVGLRRPRAAADSPSSCTS